MLRVATRGSALARWQAEYAVGLLRHARPDIEVGLEVVETTGDRRGEVPIWEMGGQGVFVKEVQQAVLDARADVAVHSAKDLPSEGAPGLALVAVPVRADPRDALVGSTLESLRKGATVATGSVRRRAQLAWARPDLDFVGLRGNIATRLGKVPPGGALVVASAALDRLGLAERAAQRLDTTLMLPQVGQGAIALECREGDEGTVELLRAIDRPDAHDALRAERAFLRRLGGGCDLPVGAFAHIDAGDRIVLEAMVADVEGTAVHREVRQGARSDAEAIGSALADILYAAASTKGVGSWPWASAVPLSRVGPSQRPSGSRGRQPPRAAGGPEA